MAIDLHELSTHQIFFCSHLFNFLFGLVNADDPYDLSTLKIALENSSYSSGA